MFYYHYLGNKKPSSLACNLKQVYAAILKSSKNKHLFKNRQVYSRNFSEIFLKWFL